MRLRTALLGPSAPPEAEPDEDEDSDSDLDEDEEGGEDRGEHTADSATGGAGAADTKQSLDEADIGIATGTEAHSAATTVREHRRGGGSGTTVDSDVESLATRVNAVAPSRRRSPAPSATAERTQQEPERYHFTLGLATAPVAGVLLLLASTVIPGHVIREGIVGIAGVRPYDIMTLFLSFVSTKLAIWQLV